MSDFLGHLVARSLDLGTGQAAPAVRPRLASRFEPVEPARAPVWGESAEEVVAPVESAAWRGPVVREAASFAEKASVETPRPRPHPPGPPLPSPTYQPGEGGRRQLLDQVLERETVFLPSPGGRGGDGRGAGGEVLRPEDHVTAPLSTPPPPHPPVQANLRSEAPTPPAPPRLAPPEPPASELRAREERPRVEPVIRRIEVERVLTPAAPPPVAAPASPQQAGPAQAAPAPEPAPVFLQPRVQVVESDPSPVRREEPAAAPVIQVTIGRIEVRATPALKAPARERPAARPAVDLEEYLRQRARGEGR